jgi:hypothetical protein
MTRRLRGFALLAVLTPLCPTPTAQASTDLRRFAIVAGANRGSQDRVALRYAITDAERFASVLTRMGGVNAADLLVLREPTRQAFLDALAVVRDRAARAHLESTRTEVILYYSGHADEKGLMLGRETIPYRELKDAMHAMATDVGITVLDACASGVITRLKGGQQHPAFMTDESMQMQGYAFLTSSSENEAAQESDRLQGSYFTHSLVSGLRGAADTSGDGKVTLGEAYQFAFNETLAQTTTTQAGAQHPAYDIRMAGTGDVVMTDVRENSASIILGPEFDGRFFVRNSKRQLVAELYKPGGRTVEIGLEPGKYEIHYEQEPQILASTLTLAEGERRALNREAFSPASKTHTQRRGPDPEEKPSEPESLKLLGRTRFDIWGGFSGTGVSVNDNTQGDTVDVSGASFGMSFAHWVREDLALEVGVIGVDLEAHVEQSGSNHETSRTNGSFGLLFGARYFFPPATFGGAFRPFLLASAGPFTTYRVVSSENHTEVGHYDTTFGGRLGGGVDFLFGHHFNLLVHLGTTLRVDHSPEFTTGLGMGFTWGDTPKK